MLKLINKKFIFASLIISLVLIFIINIFVSEVYKNNNNAIIKTKKEDSEKISGVQIHQKKEQNTTRIKAGQKPTCSVLRDIFLSPLQPLQDICYHL